ncbi:MAG: DNA polymerase III subunit alpha [Patescibacteria group bacterium]|nr:DNA polymerase III subunit alpha [Patescibacteria group bacterium]
MSDKNPNKSNFVHLHVHSHYSLLDGLAKIDELLDHAKELGMDALALTDHGVLYGAIEFHEKAKKRGIKPIIGCEMYLAPNGREMKRPKIDDVRHHLILLAKNEIGYKNLMKLVTIAHLEGFYYKPRVDKEALRNYSEGLIALSACVEGEVPATALSGKIDEAEKLAREYEEIFGKGNFYLELQDHPKFPNQKIANDALIEISKRADIPLVATTDMHYVRPDDKDIQDILLCVQTNRKVSESNRMNLTDFDLYMRSPEEMQKSFTHVPEALENTCRIADMCVLEIELGNIKLPLYEVPKNYTPESYLRELCEKGIEKRYGKNPPQTHRDRMEFELSVISKTGFASYFLIVQDFVNWAKDRGIVVGPGRGSAAGSFVSYILGITNIDPIKYNLLFERFLNPERISMPDVDMDFADARRDEVLAYVREKYGNDHVAQIITFGTMAARAAVRDAGRALGYPYNFCDQTAKLIPANMPIQDAVAGVPELSNLYNSDPAAKKLLDSASRLEGVARHASMHACGVVITPEPVVNYTPLQYVAGDEKNVVTQYSASTKSSYVEKIGLLKMDFLGLKNLTIIQHAIKIIEKTKGVKIVIDDIPLDDKKTYELLQSALTTGVFQLESGGMKRYLRQLKPTSFEDVIAMVALYRPGPMDWIPDFIARKHGRKKITYIHPKLEPILKNTYGVAVYQEQVMQIARALAGFPLSEAYILIKAVGKKIPELIREEKVKFIEGCVKNGIDRQIAEKVFAFIEPFAGYGFNRSHAACYALIGYQTAYLKAHYPTEFMAALLTSDQDDIDRIAIEIEEARQMEIEVLPPNVNESFVTFAALSPTTSLVKNKPNNKYKHANQHKKVVGGKKEKIRFGLGAIKNVGKNVASEIVEERKRNGKYKNLTDFIERIQIRDLNKKSLESLVKSGALDEFGERNQLLSNVENILNYSKDFQRNQNSNQVSLFGIGGIEIKMPGISLSPAESASKMQRLGWEKELLGLYVSDSPLAEFSDFFRHFSRPIAEIDESFSGQTVTIGGIIENIKKIFLKSQKNMAFIGVEDAGGQKMEIIAFPKTLEQYGGIFTEGNIILASGKISLKDGTSKLLCDEVRLVNQDEIERYRTLENQRKTEEEREKSVKKIFIPLPKNSDSELLRRISGILSEAPAGNCRIYLETGQGKLETPYRIRYDKEVSEKIQKVLKNI